MSTLCHPAHWILFRWTTCHFTNAMQANLVLWRYWQLGTLGKGSPHQANSFVRIAIRVVGGRMLLFLLHYYSLYSATTQYVMIVIPQKYDILYVLQSRDPRAVDTLSNCASPLQTDSLSLFASLPSIALLHFAHPLQRLLLLVWSVLHLVPPPYTTLYHLTPPFTTLYNLIPPDLYHHLATYRCRTST